MDFLNFFLFFKFGLKGGSGGSRLLLQRKHEVSYAKYSVFTKDLKVATILQQNIFKKKSN